jgi:hypothetical protein
VRVGGDPHGADAQYPRQAEHVLDQPAGYPLPHPPRLDEQLLQLQRAAYAKQQGITVPAE